MVDKPKSRYLSDHWTTDDALNFGVFQPALMDILEHADTPLILGEVARSVYFEDFAM